NWSDVSKWSGGTAPGGRLACSLDFDKIAQCSIANDLEGHFPLCRLVLGEGGEGFLLTGNPIRFTKNSVSGFPPLITVGGNRRRLTFDLPVELASNLHVQTANSVGPNSLIAFRGVVSGTGGLVLDSYGEPDPERINSHDANFGILQFENTNTYSGGTVVNGGKVLVLRPDGLGTGPVTLNDFGTLAANGRISNAVTVNAGRICDSTCDGPVTLNAMTDFYGNCDIHGEMGGPGGLTMLGRIGNYLSMIPGGTVTLHGACTYAGPTTVFPGTLLIKKAAGLYGGDSAKWTPGNIVVHKMATLRLNAGGRDEFTGEQVGRLLGNLTRDADNNGLMGGSSFCLDTTNATGTVVLSERFTDSPGSGGGPITFRKCGTGTLQLAGDNSYSGRTYVEGGTLIVNSLNSVEKGRAGSSLGAPTTLEDGMIDLGGDCALVYVGTGEATDRVLDLNGEKQTVTLDQSGAGLLRFTSAFDISGYGFDKVIVLQGSGTGSGELAGGIADPHDRRKEATTAITKTGTGLWTLSGTNTQTGPTTILQGTLAISTVKSLGGGGVSIDEGALLALKFQGEATVRKLTLGGTEQAAGTYNAANAPGFIKGTGSVTVRP
ncbi:MAG: autotransporter-associated beta strand repeat-containing protein, partial [Verrucomicrobia bacterium]|nr:autotransporter-associated beta strand repeat-containing protein [Verrucomicrobiota bacterium]